MGNLIPLDASKKEQIEDMSRQIYAILSTDDDYIQIAKDFLATFGKEYVLAYGAEFTKMKLKQIDQETFGEGERKKELMYRKKMEPTEPHKMGFLTKKGAIVKNWKRRYFVVKPDYSINYYENEEVHAKSGKPKGVILLAGYQVEESADNGKLEKLKALAKTLGLNEEELPLPDKFPEHTLALMHERRRSYYITAADEEEKAEWVEMFKTCCRNSKGFKNKDPIARAAFKIAYRRACREVGWYGKSECGGTEEQVLSETIVEIINYRVLSNAYSSLTGNFTIRNKVRKQVMKTMDSLVLALVVPSYKGMVESIEKIKGPLEKTFNEKKDEIVSVQKKLTEQLSDKLGSIATKVVEEAIADIRKMFEELKELAGRSSAEMKEECVVRLMKKLIKTTTEDGNAEEAMKKYYRIFDNVILSTWAWDHWYKVYNMEKEAIGIITKYQETFDQRGGYSAVYASHDFLTEVADAAFFTFEETFKERTNETDIKKDSKKAAELMETIKNEIIPKYDADSSWTPQDISFKQTTMVVLEYITKKIDPLTKDIRKTVESSIPDPLKQIVSLQDRYDLYVEECVKELIRKAAGIAKPEQNGSKKKPKTQEIDKGNENKETEKKEEETQEKKQEKEQGIEQKTEQGNEQEKEQGNEQETEQGNEQEREQETEREDEQEKGQEKDEDAKKQLGNNEGEKQDEKTGGIQNVETSEKEDEDKREKEEPEIEHEGEKVEEEGKNEEKDEEEFVII